MRILQTFQDLSDGDRGASAAIGNFDGVHLGHRKVIDLARQAGRAIGAPLGVVTFEPHPREVFAPDAPPFRLMNAEAKASRLAKIGVDRLYQLGFTPALAALSAEEFARDVLAGGLGLRHVVVGADFRFGRGREGDVAMLDRLGRAHGYATTVAPLLAAETRAVSSTAIRAALAEGQTKAARAMLGHWHRIEGPVIHGEKRGRELGYPTANMSLDGLHLPRLGVYAVLVDVISGPGTGRYHGVASLGVRPMFGENAPNLETHIFGFDGDLYGRHISVALVEWLRGEQKFDGLEALIAQMDRDSDAARGILAAL
ncbi:bifunctional riboflavin kinase/FAD synthetase [Mangrovicoccus algicola]|uniref:Riboflavin biosynthesis protein n=1 Tax=Mangrovicoccus algicola TaxID=2771008 RepID=A0A8J6YU10_9RHOB|nr:bifunctional riboflavin kinase/FAD synthetase [Mangrovicoccus algicola]MBE3637537.1 bifunctional riboflavin kinase/FAD synthetase [Mangrovicoccus algicola]